MNKKELELILSQLKGFVDPKSKLEQITTGVDVASDALWKINSNKHIKGKTIADLGAGTGVFGLGALMLGARKVYFIEYDKEAIKIAKENFKKIKKLMGKNYNAEFLNIDVKDFKKKVSVVVQNPPFSNKETHLDKLFLIKAMEIGKVIYSFHRLKTKNFIDDFVAENGFKVFDFVRYKFPIKQDLIFGLSRTKHLKIGFWCMKNK